MKEFFNQQERTYYEDFEKFVAVFASFWVNETLLFKINDTF